MFSPPVADPDFGGPGGRVPELKAIQKLSLRRPEVQDSKGTVGAQPPGSVVLGCSERQVTPLHGAREAFVAMKEAVLKE